MSVRIVITDAGGVELASQEWGLDYDQLAPGAVITMPDRLPVRDQGGQLIGHLVRRKGPRVEGQAVYLDADFAPLEDPLC